MATVAAVQCGEEGIPDLPLVGVEERERPLDKLTIGFGVMAKSGVQKRVDVVVATGLDRVLVHARLDLVQLVC